MRDPSIDDLIGAPSPPKKRGGQLKEGIVESRKYRDQPEHEQSEALDIRDVYRGVTITWLMNAFRMDRSTVKKKMADCVPIKYSRGNIAIYDFVQAASHLAKPRIDIGEYLKTIKPTDLPAGLQTDYWDALLKRQKYERQAGDLWHTDDVLEVFGEAFKHIKTSTQLWVSRLERTTGLTSEQIEILNKLTDTLLDDMHGKLVSMKKTSTTRSSKESEDDV